MLDEAELRRLLADQPHGEYLLEQRTDGWRVLWRLSEGAPEDEALTPAGDWTIGASAAA